jgi:intracellular sulfur oxidation DsrE/DsrF family protein
MNRKTFLQSTILAVGATFLVGCAAQMPAPAAGRSHVVFQVSDNDPGKWNLALNNAKNVQDAFGANKVDVEIVVYGPGIGMLKAEAPTANRVTGATKDGVQIVACENTMTAQKLTKADMNPAIGYVPGGVIEIMKRQGEGWAYIRP